LFAVEADQQHDSGQEREQFYIIRLTGERIRRPAFAPPPSTDFA
jgi:hypothetical protein